MARPWTVARHDAIEKLEDNLWAVNGDVPGFSPATRFHRRMQIVKLSDGRLVFHNAVPIDDAALMQVHAWGKPAMLIIPHHLHAIDAHPFQARLGVPVFTARQAMAKVRAIVEVAGTLEDLPKDPALQCEPLAGTRFGEAAYVVRTGARASLIFCDAIMNSRPGTGFVAVVFNLLGAAGPEPKIPWMYRLRAIRDTAALKRDLLRLAETPGLVRVVPSHGEIVEQDPAGAIRRAVAQV
ncbi:MAG: hypothetical protein ACJ79C_20060 [Myxococcales bacterium]